jgi:hypothetical protein
MIDSELNKFKATRPTGRGPISSEESLRNAMLDSVGEQAADAYLSMAVAEGVVQGLKIALKDEELMEDFWKAGFEHLTTHAGSGASQWVGKRILIAAIAAVFIWALGWLFRNGAFK